LLILLLLIAVIYKIAGMGSNNFITREAKTMNDRIKVLLVDDEDRFCETTSKLLIKKRFDASFANNAEKAIDILKENPRDVIVLDINMAGMDGLAALNEIKKTDPEIQVIMLTGHGSKYSAMRALVRDAFDYLAKPCDVEILASRIHDAYMTKHHGYKIDDKKALNIMTRLTDLMTVSAEITVRQAMGKMLIADEDTSSWPLTRKKDPGLLLIQDKRGVLVGVLTEMDIIRAVRPEYVSAGRMPDEESSWFSTIFWCGFFSDQVKKLLKKKSGKSCLICLLLSVKMPTSWKWRT
jgi:CheY-like chemotaxis protein